MVEVDLNHIYKKYQGNDRYSVASHGTEERG